MKWVDKKQMVRVGKRSLVVISSLLVVVGVALFFAGRSFQGSNRQMAKVFPLECDAPDVPVRKSVSGRFGFTHLFYGWFHQVEARKKPLRVLLLGFDSSSTRLPGRTDAILVAEINPKKKRVGLISIPRDLWVEIPIGKAQQGEALDSDGAGEPVYDTDALSSGAQNEDLTDTDVDTDKLERFGRINKVYRVGNARMGKGKGHTLLKEVLERELDLPIDHTLAVDFAGFSKVVDLLGGITVDVKCPIRDNFVSAESNTGYELLSVEAGEQVLSGHQALLFSRSRHGRTDMDRARRQQAVLMAIARKALGEKFWSLPDIYEEMSPYVNMDMALGEALRVAASLKEIRLHNIHGMVLRKPMVSRMTTEDGKSVVVLNREMYEKKRKKLYAFPSPGEMTNAACADANVALNWRELKKNKKDTD